MQLPNFSAVFAFFFDYSWQIGSRYLGVSMLAFFGLWMLSKRRQAGSRPLPNAGKAKQLHREFMYCVSTSVICGSLAPVILIAGLGRDLNFYADVSEYGWFYFIFSILLMIFVRDTVFYWEHRLMHVPKLFKHAHYVHHQSLQTTPLSGFSMHPLEAVFAAALPYGLILFFVPKHPMAYLIFMWVDAAVGVVTHMGYEILPRGFSRHWLGRWIGTGTAHQLHHKHPRCNYGLYFLFWDRWMGTLSKEYDRRFDIAVGIEDGGKPVTPTGLETVAK